MCTEEIKLTNEDQLEETLSELKVLLLKRLLFLFLTGELLTEMSNLNLQLIILRPISALQAETCVSQRMLGDFTDAPWTDVSPLDSHDQGLFHPAAEVDLMSRGSDDKDSLRI